MTPDPSSIEQDLNKLIPAALDETLLDRLDACTSNSLTRLNPDEIQFEGLLLSNKPFSLPAALMTSLEAIVSTTAFPQNENILPFPKPRTTTRHVDRKWFAVAAAVALCGAITALLLPVQTKPRPLASSKPAPAAPHALQHPESLVPASFNRELSEARDEGVVWRPNNNAQRVLKVVYKELRTYTAPDGRTYQIEQPRIEYILLPEKSD